MSHTLAAIFAVLPTFTEKKKRNKQNVNISGNTNSYDYDRMHNVTVKVSHYDAEIVKLVYLINY